MLYTQVPQEPLENAGLRRVIECWHGRKARRDFLRLPLAMGGKRIGCLAFQQACMAGYLPKDSGRLVVKERREDCLLRCVHAIKGRRRLRQ